MEIKKGKKYDQDKLRFDLIPIETEKALAEVLTFGAKKYGENNWQLVENGEARYVAALLRHLSEYRMGNKIDEESKLLHLSHAYACVTFLLYNELKETK